jgi:hypothetical protein
MKKIIAAFDGLKYAESTRQCSIYLAKQTKTHLVGVFLDDPTYTSYKIYDVLVEEENPEQKLKKLQAKDNETRHSASVDFEKACQFAGIEYTVHHDHNFAIRDLKHESIYADLMVIYAGETLTHHPEKTPTRFIRDLLGDVQCPVLLVPAKFRPLEKIVLLYDGEPSSVHAIKMFSYLMPQLKHLPTEVVTVKPYQSTLHLPDQKLMKEFMKRHYPTAKYTVMKGFADEEMVKYLKQSREQALIVLGSYRRGTVSRWFRESMADILMKEVKMPLFIAHNK